MAKVHVRVTMFADPIEVDEDELPNLRHQGLLIEEPAPDPQPDPVPAAAKQPVRKPAKAPEPEPTKET